MGLIIAFASIALVLPASLFVLLLSQGTMTRDAKSVAPAETTAASLANATGSAQEEQASSRLAVALSSSERIEANAGEMVAFPIVIDATGTLPARSIVSVTALPEGAEFSEGRPYGATGWSLRPEETGALQLRLPAQSSFSNIRLELVSGDGTVLAQSETRLSVTPAPVASAPFTADHIAGEPVAAEPVPGEPVAAIATEPSEPVAAAVETTGSIASVPPPTRKPTVSAGTDSSVKVNKVKAITIPAPRAARPHDGAYALAPAQDDPQASGGEWMATKTAVDMHAKALQSSETVKVADKGLKLRVTARDKNWIQVHDPKTSTTGWIYNRFLTPADPPAQ